MNGWILSGLEDLGKPNHSLAAKTKLRTTYFTPENAQKAVTITFGNVGAAGDRERGEGKTRKIPLKLVEKHFDS